MGDGEMNGGAKIIEGAKEALAVAQGDPRAISKIRVTPSCGCVFCDLRLMPVDGFHLGRDGEEVPCPLAKAEGRAP
jgi:hypothetical protein